MLDYDETLSWMETPRMRWRVLGVGIYVKSLLMSVLRYASTFALLLLLVSLRTNPFWHWAGLRVVLIGALVGSVMRLLIECFPAEVRVHRLGCSPRGSRRFSWSDCRNIRWVELQGIARLDVEVPRQRNPGSFQTVTIAVPTKYKDQVVSIISDSARPSPVLPDGPVPLSYAPRRFSPLQAVAFQFGLMLALCSVMLLGILAWGIAFAARVRGIIIPATLLVAGALGTAGVLCIRYGLPLQRELMRQAIRRREREAARKQAQNDRGK